MKLKQWQLIYQCFLFHPSQESSFFRGTPFLWGSFFWGGPRTDGGIHQLEVESPKMYSSYARKIILGQFSSFLLHLPGDACFFGFLSSGRAQTGGRVHGRTHSPASEIVKRFFWPPLRLVVAIQELSFFWSFFFVLQLCSMTKFSAGTQAQA